MKIKYPQKYIEQQKYNFCGLIVNYKAAQVLFKYYKKIGKISYREELKDYAIGLSKQKKYENTKNN